jgi:hypothetical protein
VRLDTGHDLIITHEVTNAGSDRSQLARIEILACDQTGVTVTLPKPMTSAGKSDGRFGKQDFVDLFGEDVYRCPARGGRWILDLMP